MSDTEDQMHDKDSERPLVTFALLAYNQEAYIIQAVEGALAQDYHPLEIILSDDCSTDRTYEIIKAMLRNYKGPHKVIINRNSKNLGLASHFNKVALMSAGDFVVIAAGDDISLPNRSSDSVRILKDFKKAGAVLLSAKIIDKDNNFIGTRILVNESGGEEIQSMNDLFKWRHTTFGAARAIRRELISDFPPLNEECPTEDTPLLLRSLMYGASVQSNVGGIIYRKHDKNLGSIESQRKMNIAEIYQQYGDDIFFAEQNNMISAQDAKKFKEWAASDKTLRTIRIKLSCNEKLSMRELFFILRFTNLSLKKRFSMFIRGFNSYF